MIERVKLNRRIFLATACGAGTASMIGPARADTLDDIRAKGSITIGVGVMGTKPWVYKNDDGSYAGLEYEMMYTPSPKWASPNLSMWRPNGTPLFPG